MNGEQFSNKTTLKGGGGGGEGGKGDLKRNKNIKNYFKSKIFCPRL